ncbi:MAG: carboxymuconolactone decarboxylase family protein [Solirubrobacteraceae bacterium]
MAAQPDETPLLKLLAQMTAASLEATSLDDEQLMLVRIAALASVDAPTASYLLNLGAASDSGVSVEQIQGVLAGVAPIVGTARVISAAGRLTDALGVAIELSDLGEE